MNSEKIVSVEAQRAFDFYKVGFDIMMQQIENYLDTESNQDDHNNFTDLLQHIKKLDLKNVQIAYESFPKGIEEINKNLQLFNELFLKIISTIEKNKNNINAITKSALVTPFLVLLKIGYLDLNLIFNLALVYVETEKLIESTNSSVTWQKTDASIPMRHGYVKQNSSKRSSRTSLLDQSFNPGQRKSHRRVSDDIISDSCSSLKNSNKSDRRCKSVIPILTANKLDMGPKCRYPDKSMKRSSSSLSFNRDSVDSCNSGQSICNISSQSKNSEQPVFEMGLVSRSSKSSLRSQPSVSDNSNGECGSKRVKIDESLSCGKQTNQFSCQNHNSSYKKYLLNNAKHATFNF